MRLAILTERLASILNNLAGTCRSGVGTVKAFC